MSTDDDGKNEQSDTPTPPRRCVLKTVCPFILGTELGERLAYYGLALNAVNYMKKLGAQSATAASVASSFSGCAYLMSLVGGWIADAHLGRYNTILNSGVVYILGLALLTGSASIPGIRVADGQHANVAQWMLFAFSLVLIALGTGGIKPNVSAFGADQFDETKEQDLKERDSFFSWFFVFINVGALLASTVIVYIEDQGMWGIAFFTTSVIMLFSVVLFVVGRPFYTMKPASESSVAQFVMISVAAIRNRHKGRIYSDLSSSIGHGASASAREATSSKRHWLDWAVGDFSKELVYDIKLVYRVIPIFFTSVCFWAVASQISGLYLLQANQADRRVKVFGHHTEIPSASLDFFPTAAIVLFVPLYDHVVLPLLKRYLHYKPTLLQRIGAGLSLPPIAILIAYLMEKERLRLYREGKFYIGMHDGSEVEIVEMSVWWLILPRILDGVSQSLAAVGLLDFYYSEAPETMKSIMSAMNILSMSFGGYFLSALVYTIHSTTSATDDPWLTDNLNEGHLDYTLLLLLGVAVIMFISFLFVAHRYEYKATGDLDASELVPLTSFASLREPSVVDNDEEVQRLL